jgi:hypothetical protein
MLKSTHDLKARDTDTSKSEGRLRWDVVRNKKKNIIRDLLRKLKKT